MIFVLLFACVAAAKGNSLRHIRQVTATCFDGSRAVGTCTNNRCSAGYRCDLARNYCCLEAPISTMPLCPDGTAAAAGCRNGVCGSGYTCQLSGTTNVCCRSTTVFPCPNNAPTAGACSATQTCPGTQYTCVSNVCCFGQTTATGNCPNGQPPVGGCINGQCALPLVCNGGTICC